MDPQIRADHKQVACPIPRVCLTDLMLPKSQPPIEVEEAVCLRIESGGITLHSQAEPWGYCGLFTHVKCTSVTTRRGAGLEADLRANLHKMHLRI